MKYANLKQIQSFLGKFKKITAIRRAGDMAIFIEFDGELGLFFDLSKADSAIYANPDFLNVKEYKLKCIIIILFSRLNFGPILSYNFGYEILKFKTNRNIFRQI
nr:hypothetical protein [uncultured Campylobacter sp.]